MTEAQIISKINTQIKANGVRAITGTSLNEVLRDMVQSTENRILTIPTIVPADNTPISTGSSILQSLIRLQAQISAVPTYTLTTDYLPMWDGTTFVDSPLRKYSGGTGLETDLVDFFVVNTVAQTTLDVTQGTGNSILNLQSTDAYLSSSDSATSSIATFNLYATGLAQLQTSDAIDILAENTITIDANNSTTGIINIGTGSANQIHIGNNTSEVFIHGTRNWVTTTDFQTTDKLIRFNKGGVSNSAFSTGFEIEEAGSVTGYIKTNASRNGWLLKTPDTYEVELDLTSLTANRSALFQDSSGTIAWLSDVAAVANIVWSLNGNAGTNPNTNFLGTTDTQDLTIRTDDTQRVRISATGKTIFGTGSTFFEKVSIFDATASDFSLTNGSTNRAGMFLTPDATLYYGLSSFFNNKLTFIKYNANSSSNGFGFVLNATDGSFTFSKDYTSGASATDFIWDRANTAFGFGLGATTVGAKVHIREQSSSPTAVLRVDSATNPYLFVEYGGNLGFGTDSPSGKADFLSPFIGYTGSIFKIRQTANNPILNITTTASTGLNVVNWESFSYDITLAGSAAYFKVKHNVFQQYIQVDPSNSSISTKTFAGGTGYNAGLQNYYEFSGTVIQTSKSNTLIDVANTGGTFADSLEGIRIQKSTWTNSSAIFRPIVTQGGWSGFGTFLPTSTVHIVGQNSGSTTHTLLVANSLSVSTLTIRDDGYATIDGLSIGKGLSRLASNVVFGYNALASNITGFNNFAFGYETLQSNTSGQNNVGIGHNVLKANLTGNDNVGIGTQVLRLATSVQNTGVGAFALYNLTSGIQNTSIGNQSMLSATLATLNTAVGYYTLRSNLTGQRNVAIGWNALDLATNSFNVGIGYRAGANITTGEYNTVVGNDTGATLSTGNYNTIIGRDTGRGIDTGSRNTIIGASVSSLPGALSDSIIIATGNGTISWYTNSSGNTMIGGGFTSATSRLEVIGVNSSSANTAFTVKNLAGDNMMYIRNDRVVSFHGNDVVIAYNAGYAGIDVNNYKALKLSMSGSYGDIMTSWHNTGETIFHRPTRIFGNMTPSSDIGFEIGNYGGLSAMAVKNIAMDNNSAGGGMLCLGKQGSGNAGGSATLRFQWAPVSFGQSIGSTDNNWFRIGIGVDAVNTHRVNIAEGLKVVTGGINATLQTGNAGLSSGDFYKDTAANILANGDLVIGIKI